MIGFKTVADLKRLPKSQDWHYGFVTAGKNTYQLCAIRSGHQIKPLFTFKFPLKEASRFFSDLYEQLKAVIDHDETEH